MAERRPRKDKKYRYTRDELKEQIYAALMWASDGLEYTIPGQKPVPLVMGDPENLSFILAEALTVGLPEDDPAAATS
jgi:hypothetical protein